MSRRGYALVELLAVIAVGSVLLGIACGLLALLMGIEQSSQESLRRQVTLANLARQFRSDAGGCTRVAEGESSIFVGRKLGLSPTPGNAKRKASPGWRFEAPEGAVVQYRVQGTSLVRVLIVGGLAREREAYQLPEDAQVSLELSAARGPVILSLLITTPQGERVQDAPRAVEIDAALGADRMLLETATAERGSRREVSP
jgi:prepilin-type N-terminal cleavage/methylation domain-containing protein